MAFSLLDLLDPTRAAIAAANEEVRDESPIVGKLLNLPREAVDFVTSRDFPQWALYNLTPAGQAVQGSRQVHKSMTEPGMGLLERVAGVGEGAGQMVFGGLPMMDHAIAKGVASGIDDTVIPALRKLYNEEYGVFAGPKAKGWKEAVDRGETFLGKYDQMPRFEIDDSGARFNPQIAESGTTPTSALSNFEYAFDRQPTLGDILDHPKLYEQYPEFPGTVLEYGKGNSTGYYSPERNVIGIGSQLDLYSDDRIKNTLLHEIQHAIQEQEEFASGGTAREFARGYQDRVRDLYVQIDAINGQLKEASGTPRYDELLDARDLISEEIRAIEGPYGIGAQEKGHDQYLRLAGEIEARDIAARSNLTPEQRRAIAPYSSEDIPVENAIVRFGGNGPSMSDQPIEDLSQRMIETAPGVWRKQKDVDMDLVSQLMRDLEEWKAQGR